VGAPGADRGARFPRAILVDFWNTLAFYPPPLRRRMAAEHRRLRVAALTQAGIAPERARRAVADDLRASRAEERRGSTPPVELRLRRLGRRLGVPLPVASTVRAIDRAVRTHPPRRMPAALAALSGARRREIRLGIVSNVRVESRTAIHRLLRDLGLAAAVDAVVLSAEDGVAKPDPRPLLRCLRRLGVRPEDAWMIGDSPLDLKAARRAGALPVRFVARPRRPVSSRTRELRLEGWKQLEALLRAARDPRPSP
jgi:FMN phosphatase YigB (HAD superfamily)